MALYNADNYAASRIDSPAVKYPGGEYGGVAKKFIDRRTLVGESVSVGLNATDEINLGYIPKGALVVDVLAKIDKSLGATGIFSLGFRATTDSEGNVLAEDADAFISAIDGGGQAVTARPHAGAAGLFQRFGQDTQIFVTCTEVMDDSVVDGILTISLDYVIN